MKKHILFVLPSIIISLIIAVGSVSFFGPCVHEDGSFGACHWAGQALFGIGMLLAALNFIALVVKSEDVRRGLLIAIILTTLLGFFIPGGLISLCRMASMRCRSVMMPSVRVLCVLVLLLSVISFLNRKKHASPEQNNR